MTGGRGKKVIVLGTGVAGLTSAYELSNAGYDVTVLEARDRVGGRSWTAKKGTKFKELGGEEEVCDFDEGLYINPGPWRIPYFHRGYLHYAKKFGVPVELFNNDNDQSFINYEKGTGALAGKPIRKVGVAADMRGYATEMLAKQVRQGALDADFGPPPSSSDSAAATLPISLAIASAPVSPAATRISSRATGQTPARIGNAHYQIVPYNSYTTRDGRQIFVMAHTDKFWQALLDALTAELPAAARPRATSPHHDPGSRTEPPMSVPRCSGP